MKTSRQIMILVLILCMSLSTNSEYMDFFRFRDTLVFSGSKSNKKYNSNVQSNQIENNHEIKKGRRISIV